MWNENIYCRYRQRQKKKKKAAFRMKTFIIDVQRQKEIRCGIKIFITDVRKGRKKKKARKAHVK